MYVATERETSDNTEATRFSQCAHDQRRRLEAEDCNSIRCAQLISGGRRRIRPCPPHCLAHARPTMCCIRLVIQETLYNWASVSEPHTCDFNATFSLYICICICDRHCTSNIAINISIFHLGLIRGARAYCPDARGAARSGRPHPLLKPLPTGAEL